MVDLESLLTDLAEESADLDALVAGRGATEWTRLTPAPGWTIAHQIAHLAWTDHVALLAATDPDGFLAAITVAAQDPAGFVDRGAMEFLAGVGLGHPERSPATAPPDGSAPHLELLQRWRAGRDALAGALRTTPPGVKLPWYGTRMSATSMATARIMETWAHGQDVADALGVSRTPTARLRHIAHLGTRTLGHSFATHGRAVPDSPVRVELVGPPASRPGDGEAYWIFGPADATNVVAGPALDFCLLVTQRRHRAELALVATGPIADEWLDVAQAFAGPPGLGRQPGGTPS
jgi:uncharacterized protein (TIGR03084 family)